VADATCGGCGCGCDDIEATVADGRLAGVTRTCPLGDAWLAERGGDRPPPARIDGQAVDLDEAAEAAAAILSGARAPLVYGLGQTSCEAQRRAVALAEALGAVVDPAGGSAASLAYQAIGASTATFGEIRDRAELVVAWRTDPAMTNPRLLGRLRVESRTLVAVDEQRTATADEADAFVELDATLDFEALWALRALVRRAPLDRDRAAGLPLDGLDELAERLLAARHVALLYGDGPTRGGDAPARGGDRLAGAGEGELAALALHALVRDLGRDRHAVALGLQNDGNARGAEDVLAWQSGFPAAVSFARGYPRANPGEFGVAGLLARGEVDAALVIASDPLGQLPVEDADRLSELPIVVVDARASATAAAARVAFATAADGIEVAGTVHRMDGVPVPLRAPLAGERPGVEDVLAAIAGRL
jgi:formylmethanofuran dehydrogenase subunit B